MTMRIYRWDDASAPTLSGAAGAMIAVLDAVLVNGYGSKVAAGWTKAYAGTNEAGYTNSASAGGTGFGIKVSHTATAYAAGVVGYESITSGGVITNQFPTSAQAASGLFMQCSSTLDSTARPWLIAADAKRFHMWVGFSVATSAGLATTAAMPIVSCGDLISNKGDDAYHFLVSASTSSTNSATTNLSAALSSMPGTNSGHYIARSYTQTGTSLAVGKHADVAYTSTVVGGAGATYPDPVGGGMLLSPIYIHEATGIRRGRIAGLWCPLHVLPGSPGDTFSGTGDLAGKSFLLLDGSSGGSRGRFVLETSDTWS